MVASCASSKTLDVEGRADNSESGYPDFNLMQNVLRPVRPQDTRNVKVEESLLLALDNAHNFKGLVSKFPNDRRRRGDVDGELFHTLGLGRYKYVTSEHEDLEAGIGRAHILDFDRLVVAPVKNNCRRKTLADNQLRRLGRALVWIGGGDDGWRILHSHSGCEATVRAERSENDR